MRVTASVWVKDGEDIEVRAPRNDTSASGEPLLVPWIVTIGHQVNLHVDSREALTELRDALTAALVANPEVP